MASKRRGRRQFGLIRTLPSGRHQASYVGPDGARHTAPHTYDAKVDAEGWLSREARLIQLEEWTPPALRSKIRAGAGTPLRTFADQWMAERDLAPKTRAHYQQLLDQKIYPALGGKPIGQITAPDVRTWWAGMTANTSRKHAYRLLRAILNTAAADKSIAENPCQIKGVDKIEQRDIEMPTLPQLTALVAAMPEAYQLPTEILAWCSLRFGELIELRRKDVVDSDVGMVIRIQRAATLVDGKLVVGDTKSRAGRRNVYVPPHVAEKLRTHLKKRRGGPEVFVFTTIRGGRRLTANAFRPAFKKAAKSIGMPQLRIHDLRHVGAVLTAQSGATTKELMSRLGHSTPQMAMLYQHAAAERDAEIANRLSKMVAVEDSEAT